MDVSTNMAKNTQACRSKRKHDKEHIGMQIKRKHGKEPKSMQI